MTEIPRVTTDPETGAYVCQLCGGRTMYIEWTYPWLEDSPYGCRECSEARMPRATDPVPGVCRGSAWLRLEVGRLLLMDWLARRLKRRAAPPLTNPHDIGDDELDEPVPLPTTEEA